MIISSIEIIGDSEKPPIETHKFILERTSDFFMG